MADHKAARDRCEAFIKDQTEDVSREELAVFEECPICFDTYDVEKPIRIKVEGCRHILGRKCVSAILTTNPRLEKRCPLCRTKWMDAPAGTPADRFGDMPRLVPGHFRVDVATGWPTLLPSRAPPSGTAAGPAVQSALVNTQGQGRGRRGDRAYPPGQPASRIISLVDSDGENDSFNSITRDINSVRERARNTQSTRRQRKEDKKKPDTSYARYRRPSSGQRDNTGRNYPGQPHQQAQQEPFSLFSEALWDPVRHQQLLDPMQRNAGPSNNPTDADAGADQPVQSVTTPEDAMVIDEPGIRITHTERDSPLAMVEELRVEDNSSPVRQEVAPTRAASVCTHPPTRSSSLYPPAQRRNAFRRPFILSPSPESDADNVINNAVENAQPDSTRAQEQPVITHPVLTPPHHQSDVLRTRKAQLDQREKNLTQRENRLRQRENDLEIREQRLVDQQIDRERHGVMWGGAMMLRARQMDELEAMLARHRRESENE